MQMPPSLMSEPSLVGKGGCRCSCSFSRMLLEKGGSPLAGEGDVVEISWRLFFDGIAVGESPFMTQPPAV